MRENKPHSGESASPQSSLLRSLNSFQDDPDILSCARKKTQRDNVQEDDFKCIRIDWISVAWEERITQNFSCQQKSLAVDREVKGSATHSYKHTKLVIVARYHTAV